MSIISHAGAGRRGFTLTELLVAVAVLGLIMTGLLTLMMSGNQTYLTGSNQADAQGAARAVLERMTTDLREAGYDPTGTGCTGANTPAGCFSAVTRIGGTCAANPLFPQPDRFSLCYDWNGDGTVQGPAQAFLVPYVFGGVATNVLRGEMVTYRVNGTVLQRQEIGVQGQPQDLLAAVQQVARGVDCGGNQIANPPFFQYCTAAGGTAVNAEDIRSIVVNLQAGVQNAPVAGVQPTSWQAGRIQVAMSHRIRLRNRP